MTTLGRTDQQIRYGSLYVILQTCMVVNTGDVYGSMLYDETLTSVGTTVHVSHVKDVVRSVFALFRFLTGNEREKKKSAS